MRILLLTFLLLIGSFPREREVVVTKKMISVSGNTSIGGFTCDFSQTGISDTLYIDNTKSRGDLVFEIPVQGFSCGNFFLNRDFRKTIKADQFATAKVRVSNLMSNYGHYTCHMTLELVGKRLYFDGLVLNREINGLTARLNLSFIELELEAPHRMGGLIKVEEQLKLDFTLGF
jgi:hypothetical protein